MKTIYRLAAWNLRVTIKPLLLVWGLMAAGEFVALIAPATSNKGSLMNFSFYNFTLPIFVFSYIAAVFISVYPACSAAFGRSKSIYTLMTLPMPRRNILFANIVSGLLTAFGTITVQVALHFVFYYPVMKLAEASRPDAYLQCPVFIENGLFLSFMRNELLQVIFPRSLFSLLAFLTVIICTTVLLHCVPMHSGLWRVVSLVLLAGSGILGGIVLMMQYLNRGSSTTVVALSAPLAAAAVLSLWWALRSLKKAKNL